MNILRGGGGAKEYIGGSLSTQNVEWQTLKSLFLIVYLKLMLMCVVNSVRKHVDTCSLINIKRWRRSLVIKLAMEM